VVWANSQYAGTVFFLFFFFCFFAKATVGTVRQIWTNDGSKGVVPRKFGSLTTICPQILGVKPPKTEILGCE